MNNSLVKVGIICPCVDEYTSCKEILKLNNETKSIIAFEESVAISKVGV